VNGATTLQIHAIASIFCAKRGFSFLNSPYFSPTNCAVGATHGIFMACSITGCITGCAVAHSISKGRETISFVADKDFSNHVLSVCKLSHAFVNLSPIADPTLSFSVSQGVYPILFTIVS